MRVSENRWVSVCTWAEVPEMVIDVAPHGDARVELGVYDPQKSPSPDPVIQAMSTDEGTRSETNLR